MIVMGEDDHCWFCGKEHKGVCDEMKAPWGRCDKCKEPLHPCEAHFQGGTYCDNPDCEECV